MFVFNMIICSLFVICSLLFFLTICVNKHKKTDKMSFIYFFCKGPEEEESMKSKKSFRNHSVVSQNPETELMLEGDDDAVSLLQEKEIDNLAGIQHKLPPQIHGTAKQMSAKGQPAPTAPLQLFMWKPCLVNACANVFTCTLFLVAFRPRVFISRGKLVFQ